VDLAGNEILSLEDLQKQYKSPLYDISGLQLPHTSTRARGVTLRFILNLVYFSAKLCQNILSD